MLQKHCNRKNWDYNPDQTNSLNIQLYQCDTETIYLEQAKIADQTVIFLIGACKVIEIGHSPT